MSKFSPELIDALTKSVLQQAKIFLEDADEFYPFASVVDKKKAIKPVSIYWGEEFPDATEVLMKLESVIKDGILQDKYLVAAIAVNVYINLDSPKGVEKRDALELRLHESIITTTIYFLYSKLNGQYTFEPVTPAIH